MIGWMIAPPAMAMISRMIPRIRSIGFFLPVGGAAARTCAADWGSAGFTRTALPQSPVNVG
jgi:hypothetical protein